MEAVGVTDPARCVYVGDRLFDDIWGAHNAGLRAIHVPHSVIPAEQVGHTEGEPDAVVQLASTRSRSSSARWALTLPRRDQLLQDPAMQTCAGHRALAPAAERSCILVLRTKQVGTARARAPKRSPQRSAYSSAPGNISGVPRNDSSRAAASFSRPIASARRAPVVEPTSAAYVAAQARSSSSAAGSGRRWCPAPSGAVYAGGGGTGDGVQRGDLADQQVAALAVRVVGRPQRVVELGLGRPARSGSRAGRRRRPPRARPRAWSAARRPRSRRDLRRQHAEVLGDRGGHRGEQPGQGAALGPAGGVDERGLQLLLAPADRRAGRRPASGAGPGGRRRAGRPRAPRRAGGAPGRAGPAAGAARGPSGRRSATASAAVSVAGTSSTSASSGVCCRWLRGRASRSPRAVDGPRSGERRGRRRGRTRRPARHGQPADGPGDRRAPADERAVGHGATLTGPLGRAAIVSRAAPSTTSTPQQHTGGRRRGHASRTPSGTGSSRSWRPPWAPSASTSRRSS